MDLSTIGTMGEDELRLEVRRAAEELCRRNMMIWLQNEGSKSVRLANSRNACAEVLTTRGKLDEAERLYWSAVEIFEEKLGKDHIQVTSPLGSPEMRQPSS